MELTRIVRDVGGLLSSPHTLRDVWPQCVALITRLADARHVRLVAASNEAEPDDVLLPLRFGVEDLGYVALGAPELDEERRIALEACAYAIATRLHLERFVQSSERLTELAHVDALTGVANRRRFDDVLEATCARAQAEGAPLALAVVDVDFFKAYNDRYGHQAGDACLRAIAQALSRLVRRPEDLIARYGGEEFVVLLYGADLDAAIPIAERACDAVEELAIAHRGSSLGRITISVGMVALAAGGSGTQLFHEADEALYRAKAGGRNRVAAENYLCTRPAAERVSTLGSSTLPSDLAPLVGRRRELRAIAAALESRRLVSLVGVGGCGKTRLAVEVASRSGATFEDGAWFVDLSPIASGEHIAPAIGALFNRRGDESARELAQALRSKHLLLVLDNCEHLLADAAETVATLLAEAPGLRVLATSREALALRDELVFPIETFAVPDESERDAAELRRYDCVEMFVERVRALDASLSFGADELVLAASICRRLDGIALAIELAAPRAAAVGLRHLERELREHVFPASMASFVAWSHSLLSDAERTLFRRLAVFSGGCTADAAASVCWDVEMSRADVLSALARLARKSLVTGDPTLPRARVRMLETIREFALAQLWQHEDTGALRRRHARWALEYVRSLDVMRTTERAREWLELLSAELENIRSALAWTLDEREDVYLGAELAVALQGFLRDHAPAESLRVAARALAVLPASAPRAIEAELQFAIGAIRLLPADETRRAAERALALFREIGDRRGQARALRVLAQVVGWYFRAEREAADAMACEAIEIARELDDPYELIVALRTRGLTIDISDFPAKRAALLEALALSRQLGFERLIGGNLTWISEMEFSAGERRRAYEYGREALAIAESSGSRELHGNAAVNFAIYAAALGEWETAREVGRRALQVARITQTSSAITYAVQALAMVAAGRKEYARAARLLGFCDARDGLLHPPRQADQCEDITHREVLEVLSAKLGGELDAHLAAGALLDEEQAAREATA